MSDKATSESISLRDSHRRKIRVYQRRYHLKSRSATIQFIIDNAENGLPLPRQSADTEIAEVTQDSNHD